MNPIRIAIIDDHNIVVDGLKLLFGGEEDFEVVAEGYTGEDAFSIARLYSFDVLLIDLNLPGKSGLETSKELLTIFPDMQILALTMNDSMHMIRDCLNSGLKGYILKNTEKDALLAAVRTVYDGGTVLPHGVSPDDLTEDESDNSAASIENLLTRREREVLSHILLEKTTPEIANELDLSPLTVETHRKNILHKLEVKNTAGLVKLVVTKGFMR